MRHGLLLCAIVGALVLQSCAPPPRQAPVSLSSANSDNLAAVIADVQNVETRARDGDFSSVRALPHNIEVLTRAIEGGSIQGDALLMLRYYRGVARQTLNRINDIIGLPVDRQVAEAALADFLAVAEASGDDPAKSGIKSNAIYGAGQVAATQLGEKERGYGYFRECARMKQAGCQNVMAGALVTGRDGVAQDLNAALNLHNEVYETGTTYTCAGSFSAYSIAHIVHFTDARLDHRTGLDWIRRATGLADQVKSRANGVDVCGSAGYSVDEYLMRRQAGQRDDGILARLQGDDGAVQPFAVDYLLGKSSDSTFTAELRKLESPSSRCIYAFLGAWKASIDGNAAAVRNYRSMLGEAPRDEYTCATRLIYSERLAR